ncbi:MAG: hypothetical protein L0Y56_10110 [Nitrospira sp.]|nr:hypothetical protein [Nitrospira sp.]
MATKNNPNARAKPKIKHWGECGHEVTWVRTENKMATYCFTCWSFKERKSYGPQVQDNKDQQEARGKANKA